MRIIINGGKEGFVRYVGVFEPLEVIQSLLVCPDVPNKPSCRRDVDWAFLRNDAMRYFVPILPAVAVDAVEL